MKKPLSRLPLIAISFLSLGFVGCANVTNTDGEPLVRMLIEQHQKQVIVDLDSARNVRVADISLERLRYTAIHAAGNQALVGDKNKMAFINLANGEVIPLRANLTYTDPIIALPSGAGFIARDKSGTEIQLLNITGEVRSTAAVPMDKRITDIAVCDNSKTILALSESLSIRNPATSLHSYAVNGSTLTAVQAISTNGLAHQIECAPGSTNAAYLSTVRDGVFSPLQLSAVSISANGSITNSQVINPVQLGPPDWLVPHADTPLGLNLAFAPSGNELYVRLATPTSIGAQGWLEKFSVSNGQLTPTSWRAAVPPFAFQIESSPVNIAIHPAGHEIYFPYDNLCDEVRNDEGVLVDVCRAGIMVIDTATGKAKPAIFHPSITKPERVTLETVQCLDVNSDGC